MAEEKKICKLPDGKLCGHNCADGCIYWDPYKRDSNGRQYCRLVWSLLLSQRASGLPVL